MYLNVPLILSIHLKHFQDSAGQEESSAISWNQTAGIKNLAGFERGKKKPSSLARSKSNTCCIISEAHLKTITGKLMGISRCKDYIPGYAGRYNLCSDVFVGLTIRFKGTTPKMNTKQAHKYMFLNNHNAIFQSAIAHPRLHILNHINLCRI